MKVLLCNPNTNIEIHNQAGTFKNTVAICPPLGIGYLTSILRAHGFVAEMCDFFDSPDEEIENVIRTIDPDVAGISCFTEHRGAALKLARLIKRIKPSIHVIFGGSHASFFARGMLEKYPEIDSVVINEGEMVLLDWIRRLDKGNVGDDFPPGMAVRSETGVTLTSPRTYIEDLDILPFPARDLFNVAPYKAYPHKYTVGRQATMMATRGCPYHCQFCSTTQFWGRKYRTRSVENVIREIEYLVIEKKMEYIYFFDDAMTARKGWILDLCKEIKYRKLQFDWGAITRVNYVDPDICSAMRRAGCRAVTFGVESFSDKILTSIHKNVTGAQAVAALKMASHAGLKTNCLLMVGNPGETQQTINETISGIKACRPDGMDVGLLTVFPKTELYRIACTGGLMNDAYWLDESKSAPVFTLEHSVAKLTEFKRSLFDAHWSNHWYVSLYRKLGMKRIKAAFGRH